MKPLIVALLVCLCISAKGQEVYRPFAGAPPVRVSSISFLVSPPSTRLQGCELHVRLHDGYILDFSLKNSASQHQLMHSGGPNIIARSGILIDDLVFDASWHQGQPKGLTIVFVTDDGLAYGRLPALGHDYGWSHSVIDIFSTMNGSHLRLLRAKEVLFRTFDVRPFIQDFFRAFPQCRLLSGKFFFVARIPLLMLSEDGYSSNQCLFTVVEVANPVARP
jgi:hypothetical protein